MDPLVLAAGTAVIGAMATEAWQQARAAVVRLWRRARPDQASAIEAELEATRGEVVAARQAADAATEQALADTWQRKLHTLVAADPRLAPELRRLLDDDLAPLLPAGERERIQSVQNIQDVQQVQQVQNVTASGPGAVAQGVMGGNLINHEISGHREAADRPPTEATAADPRRGRRDR